MQVCASRHEFTLRHGRKAKSYAESGLVSAQNFVEVYMEKARPIFQFPKEVQRYLSQNVKLHNVVDCKDAIYTCLHEVLEVKYYDIAKISQHTFCRETRPAKIEDRINSFLFRYNRHILNFSTQSYYNSITKLTQETKEYVQA
jgi:hypothetical protein